MKDAWVLVANGSEARLFHHTGKSLELVEQFLHPDSRRKDQEITSDHASHRETRTEGTASQRVYGSFPEPTDPHDFEIDRFARELDEKLEQHRAQNDFRELVLVAPPHFHGLVKKHMSGPLEKCVIREVSKDYTSVRERDLLEQLTPHLQ